MVNPDNVEIENLLAGIRSLAAAEVLLVSAQAHQQMAEEEVCLDEVLQAIRHGEILENYPQHRRGPCCLLNGIITDGRPLHVLCTSGQPLLILAEAYIPRPPAWSTPVERRAQP